MLERADAHNAARPRHHQALAVRRSIIAAELVALGCVTGLLGLRGATRCAGPPASSSQYQIPKIRTLVSHSTAPANRSA